MDLITNVMKSTGAVWPPYEGAGQGYWARQAGFSLSFEQQPFQQETYQEQPYQAVQAVESLPQRQFYAPQMVSGQTYWVPRQQQQLKFAQQQQHQIYAEQQPQQINAELEQQQLLQELTLEQLRAQQRELMQKYISFSHNEVVDSILVQPRLLTVSGQTPYR